MSRETWLLYALGGGLGHLQRGLALARQVVLQQPVRLLANSRAWPQIQPQLPHLFAPAALANLQVSWRSPELGLAATQEWIARELANPAATRLVVDTFPRGLVGDLADLLPRFPGPRVLVQRDLNPEYLQAKDLPAFVTRHYDRILLPGEGTPPLAALPQSLPTAPWLLGGADAVLTLAAARDRLGLGNSDRPLAIVLAAGRPEELAEYGELTLALHRAYPELVARCLALTRPPACPRSLWQPIYPALAVLPAATLAVGGGGYHTVYEAQALGLPLIAWPRSRLYDRQAARVARQMTRQPLRAARSLAAVVAAVGAWLPALPLPEQRARPPWASGAIAAAEAIAALRR